MPSKLTLIVGTLIGIPLYVAIVALLATAALGFLAIGVVVLLFSAPINVYNGIYRHFEDKIKLNGDVRND